MTTKPRFRGTEIVVVDDTELFGLCVKSFLALKGFAAIELYLSPVKALEEIAQRGRPAFIITDLEMPFMTGDAFLVSACALYPGVRGVIITGRDEVPQEITARFTVIRKDDPFFFSRLLRYVQDGVE